MVRQMFTRLLTSVLLVMGSLPMSAQQIQQDIVKIRFVDSAKNPIPYFASHYQYLCGEKDQSAFGAYLKPFPWDELLPYQDVGGGIMPMRGDKAPYFIEEIDLGFHRRRSDASKKRFKNAELPEPVKFFVWYFPNGHIYKMSVEDANHLKRDQVNVIEVPGNLGTGSWKELGDFLVDAAYFWRVDRGSKSALLKRCEALIEARKKAGDLVWAGNLVFVREHWLGANQRVGLFARAQSLQTPELDKELPWRNAGREFGHEPGGLYRYPLKPYLAFKKSLEVNPKDIRAIFWTKLLPWVNGFSLSDCKTGQTTDDYIRECKRVYLNFRGNLDDYHRFWFLKEFLRTCNGMTYEARWWLKQKGISHDADLQWAMEDLNGLFGKYPFLHYQVEELKEWLLYMKDPNQVEPLNLIDGK